MSDYEHLRELTKPALIAAQHQLETTGAVVPVFVLEYPDGRLEEMPLRGHMAQALNSGAAKDFLFDMIRARVKTHDIVATLFVCDTWVGTSDPTRMSREEFQRECNKHGNSVPALAKAGLVTMREAITIFAQTRDSVLCTTQTYERKPPESKNVELGDVQEREAPAWEFDGRQRIYEDRK